MFKFNLTTLIIMSSSLLISSIFFAPLVMHYPVVRDLKYFFFIINILSIAMFFIQKSYKITLVKRDKEIFILLNIYFIIFSIISLFHYNGNPNFLINYILVVLIFINFIIFKNDIVMFKKFANIIVFFLIVYFILAAYNLFYFILYKSLVFNFYSFEYYRLTHIFRLGMGLEDPNFISVKILVGFFLSHFILKNKIIDFIFIIFMFLSLSVAFLGILLLFLLIENYKKIFHLKYIIFFFIFFFFIFFLISTNELLVDILTRKFIDSGSSTGKSSLLVSIESRLEQYSVGIRVLSENIFGIGAENFVKVSIQYVINNNLKEYLNLQGSFHDFHNTFFQILITGGIVSFIFFSIMLLYIYKNLKIFNLKIFFWLSLIAISTINASNVLQFWLLLLLFNFIPKNLQYRRIKNNE